MNMQEHLDAFADNVAKTTALADEHTQDIVKKFVLAIEPALRNSLLNCISELCEEINAQLNGQAIVTQTINSQSCTLAFHQIKQSMMSEMTPSDEQLPSKYHNDDTTARLTLRLPEKLKELAEKRANTAGMSLNSFITTAVIKAVHKPKVAASSYSIKHSSQGWI